MATCSISSRRRPASLQLGGDRSALRLGASTSRIGNLLGSNLFNAAIITIDDVFYTKGSLLAHVSPVHAMTAGSAVIMTGLAVVGPFDRPIDRVFFVQWGGSAWARSRSTGEARPVPRGD